MRIWYLCDLGAALQERGLEKTDAQILPKIIPKDPTNNKTIHGCPFFKFASQCLLSYIIICTALLLIKPWVTKDDFVCSQSIVQLLLNHDLLI